MASRTTFGSNLDALAQANINEEDQDLRARTANQGFLAQLAGERTRRRATEANYDVGLRNQETARLASQRALDAALAGDVARMNIADVTTGRGLEGVLAGQDAAKYNSDIYGNTSRYNTDAQYQAKINQLKRDEDKEFAANVLERQKRDMEDQWNRDRLGILDKFRRFEIGENAKIARLPDSDDPMSDEFKLTLMDRDRAEQDRFNKYNQLALDANERPLTWGEWLWNKNNQRNKTKFALKDLRTQGVDVSGLQVNPTTGRIEPAPKNTEFIDWVRRGSTVSKPGGSTGGAGKTVVPADELGDDVFGTPGMTLEP